MSDSETRRAKQGVPVLDRTDIARNGPHPLPIPSRAGANGGLHSSYGEDLGMAAGAIGSVLLQYDPSETSGQPPGVAAAARPDDDWTSSIIAAATQPGSGLETAHAATVTSAVARLHASTGLVPALQGIEGAASLVQEPGNQPGTGASATTVIPPGAVVSDVPGLGGGTIINQGVISTPTGQHGTIDPSQLVNDATITVASGASVYVAAPVSSDFGPVSTLLQSTSELSGSSYTTSGLVGSDVTAPITWTGTAEETGSGGWIAYAGGMGPEILSETGGATQASTDFTNTVLQQLGAPDRAEGLAIGPSDTSTFTAAASDGISYAFSSPLPAGTSFFLWDPGASDGINGPFTFTFTASLNGAPVSTAGWSFAVEYPFNVATGTSYAVDASTGTITVSDYSGGSLPDAVIVATPDSPVNALSVNASTIGFDFWGLSFANTGPQIQVSAGATAEFAASVDAGQTVGLASGSTLRLDQPGSFAATIAGFGAGRTIDLAGVDGPQTQGLDYLAGFNNSTNLMTVGQPDGSTFQLQLALGVRYDQASFTFTADGRGGTLLTTDAAPCYCRGTRILTTTGEVAVEKLRVGDLAVLRDQGRDTLAPVRWIGQRRIDVRRHPRPELVRPVRLAADALADGVPSRPLRVSPDHALLVDGLLIQARQLVNHSSITFEEADSAHYFHVELDRHAILVADGAEAESYLDTGNRAAFDGSGVVLLHSEFGRTDDPAACAPLVTDPGRVRPVWERLARRAEFLGIPLCDARRSTNDPSLRLETADGTPLVREGSEQFLLPRPAAADAVIRICSRTAAPADFEPWCDDRRRLGVAVGVIECWIAGDQLRSVVLPLDGARLLSGWWPLEADGDHEWRWTDGMASVAVPAGTTVIQVTVTAFGRYPLPAEPACETEPLAAAISRWHR